MSDRGIHPSTRWLPVGVILLMSAFPVWADDTKRPAPGKAVAAPISMEAWRAASTAKLTSNEIDQLVARQHEGSKTPVSVLTSDEQFLRRVMLDLTGQLPTARRVSDFVADRNPTKRAKIVDELLDSKEYARHWASYWRLVISSRVTANVFGRGLSRTFETWMTRQLQENRSWADITTAILTARGEVRYDDDGSKGYAYFLASRTGPDATVEVAAETSRIFLGIQIQCAQCHNHPSDVWKQEQFHQFAAFFGKLSSRPIREENRFVGMNLATSFRDYRMPAKDDTRRGGGRPVSPRFLNGNAPGRNLGDVDRRKALVKEITSKENPWFAAAFVNRIWGSLLGQSFYQPVDDLGPQKEAMLGPVLTRLAGGFRGSDHDVKALFRVIVNSATYQRQIRLGESASEHLQFAATYPTRLSGDALWNSLNGAIGPFSRGGFGAGRRPGGGFGGPGGRFGGGLEAMFRQEFNFDPSLKPDDVEGSITQALLLMNNPQIQQRIDARGNTPLARILADHDKDADAVEQLYLRTLARKPTSRERDKCLNYVKKIGNRAEAFEDLLWALVNSTEFQTRR